MRKWFLIMAAAVMLCSACGRKDASVNGATQEAQASSTEAESLYKEGTQYIGEEDYESAIESLLKCIELDPNYSKAYIQLSKAYIGYEEYDEALAILQQGYEKTKDASLEKEQDNCVRSICQVLTDNEDYETAIPWLVKLQEIDGITVENSLQLAEAYSMMDDYENAVKILQNADQNDESIKNALLEARINYGQYCYDEGMNDQAIETLKAVINEAPDRIEAYSMLITVYVDAGKVKEAEGIVQSGLERFVNQNSTVTDDQLDEFLNSASSYYLELEDMDACLKFWEKAASMRPGNKNYKEELDSYRSAAADESYAKADELLEAGNVEGASKYYKRAFALAPANYDAGVISGGDYTYCLNKDGSWRLGWYTDETGGSYYFNPAAGRLYASAVTGYQQLDGAVYYFEDDGRMLVDDTTPDGRFADVDGKLLDHNPYEDASEEETDASEEETETAGTASIGNKQLAQALEIIEGLGGKDNIKVVNNCLTRLRVDVKDMSAVDEPRLKKTGAMGFVHSSDVHIQVIYGPKVEGIAANVREALKKETKSAPKQAEFSAPITGNVIPMEQVPDPAFSQKMMGDGFAIEPTEGIVQSPVDGIVEVVFPTGHAVGLRSDDGSEILIHLGIDTVELNGKGFEVSVKQGDRVKSGDVLVKVDLDYVKSAGKKTVSPVIFTSGEKITLLKKGMVSRGEKSVIRIEKA